LASVQGATWIKIAVNIYGIKLKGFLNVNHKTIDHIAGNQNAIKERGPFIGICAEFNHIGIFNDIYLIGIRLNQI